MPIKITMPQLSPTMEVGTLARWLVKEGDDVSSGDILAEIETDKATMEVESIDDGKVGKILVAEGTDDVPVNEVIAILLEDGEDASALEGEGSGGGSPEAKKDKKDHEADKSESGDEEEQDEETDEQDEGGASDKGSEESKDQKKSGSKKSGENKPGDDGRVKASPLARSMAKQAGLDLGALDGSGPHGRIIKRDVEAALASGGGKKAASSEAEAKAPAASAPVPAGDREFEEVKVSNMRRVIAERLQEAKQTIPHFYLTVDCEIDKLLAMRKDLNGRSDDYKISVNDFVIRALALALRKVPDANAEWAGKTIRKYKAADVAVAVAIEGGLITPVVRDADQKGLASISNEMKELAQRAREGKLAPEEYQGGTFSISNLGMYGIKQFDAVINPPQAGILAIGTGEQRPVVRDGALDIATVMSVTLSCDHRVVDGAIGADLLTAFKGFIEDPLTMLL